MEETQEEYANQDKEAREYADRVVGYKEPTADAVSKGIFAFFFSGVIPYFGLKIVGVQGKLIDIPLLVIGLLCGIAVYWYHKSRENKWRHAWAQKLIDTNSGRKD